MSTPQDLGKIKDGLLEALHVIDDATNDELVTVDEALQRLDRGLYGICKECGRAIEDVRLRALHAVTCSGCATD